MSPRALSVFFIINCQDETILHWILHRFYKSGSLSGSAGMIDPRTPVQNWKGMFKVVPCSPASHCPWTATTSGPWSSSSHLAFVYFSLQGFTMTLTNNSIHRLWETQMTWGRMLCQNGVGDMNHTTHTQSGSHQGRWKESVTGLHYHLDQLSTQEFNKDPDRLSLVHRSPQV